MLQQSRCGRCGVARNLLAAGALLALFAQPGLGEEDYGVEVLPVAQAKAEAPAEDASDEPTLAEPEPAGEPIVLVLDPAAVGLVIDYPFPPPDVSARGWDPGIPSQIRVHGAGTGDPGRIPVRGWDPDQPSRLRVHSWSAGTP